jgi:hypothetical protein
MSTLAPDGRVYNAGLGGGAPRASPYGGAPGTSGENVGSGRREVVVDSGGPNFPKQVEGRDYVSVPKDP